MNIIIRKEKMKNLFSIVVFKFHIHAQYDIISNMNALLFQTAAATSCLLLPCYLPDTCFNCIHIFFGDKVVNFNW